MSIGCCNSKKEGLSLENHPMPWPFRRTVYQALKRTFDASEALRRPVPPVASHRSFCFIGVSANRLMDGAMQLTFRKMAFDYYPFHWAGMGVLNGAVPAWPRY